MNACEIIEELPRLSLVELHAVGQRISQIISNQDAAPLRSPDTAALYSRRIAGKLVLAGPRTIRQTEVQAILDEFP